MRIRFSSRLYSGFIALVLLSACSHRIYQTIYPTLNDGRYDSEFPYRNCSAELKQIGETVKMINAIAYYKSYVFAENQKARKSQLQPEFIKQNTSEVIYFNQATSGTAVIILGQADRVALLSCAHIVSFPDTIVSYYALEDGKPSPFVQSLSIKERQTNYVTNLMGIGELNILKLDEDKDIVVLGVEFPSLADKIIPVFNYPPGKAKDLEWGSFVYLLGYPRGVKVVTRGIVSEPDRDKHGEFIVDALFNRGCSGGIVLAVKDGVPNFEFVGIAKSAAAEYEYLIRPNSNLDQAHYDLHHPYSGDLYVDYKANIQYGVTHIVPIEAIQTFFRDNYDFFLDLGYDFTYFAK
jgi:hypothetical protein